MLSTLIMTIIGADRPGLVQLVADRVAEHGGNWLESRLCRLGGEFAGIVRVELATDRAGGLNSALAALEAQGLRIHVHVEGAVSKVEQIGTLVQLQIVGNDRPGIVRQITGVLAMHGVNVEEFSSECVDAPMGGTQLFQASTTLRVPPGVSTQSIRSELEKLASDLMVDLQLSTK